MPDRDPADPAVDLTQVAESAVHHAAKLCGLDARRARLMRLFATAVYHPAAADAVARVAALTSESVLARLDTSVKMTRWLVDSGFPAVEPLPVEQPQDGPGPGVADLGQLLRRLHALPLPPAAGRPLRS